ncbi:amino acid adenylation domain-containing protein [Pseudoalteromonas sp. B62]
MTLTAAINETFSVIVALRDVFEHNTIHALGALIDSVVTVKHVNISKVSRDSVLPLSFAQQRLWLVDQLEGSSHYNVQNKLRLKGDFNYGAFEQALSSLIERHEVLRTCYVERDGQTCQVIQPMPRFVLEQVTLNSADQYKQVKQYAMDQASQSFDLSCDLMLRAQIIELETSERFLLLTIHHIAFDGVSLGAFTRELGALYQGYITGQLPELAPMPIQYADFSHWQRNWLQGEELQGQLNFWAQYLADIPTVHSLPLDKPRPAKQTFVGVGHATVIDSDLTAQIKSLCQDHNSTLFMFLQTTFSVMLARYSNETDIVIGSPVAGRTQAEVASMVGFFVNTLVLRCNLEGNPSFSDLLAVQKTQLLKAFDHQHMPFEVLVDELRPQRSLAHHALYQVVFAVQNFDHGNLEFGDLSLEPFESDDIQLSPDYELGLHVTEKDGELELYWSCNTAVFEVETLERFSQTMQVLLRGIVAAPDTSIQALPLLDTAQQQSILIDWNNTATDFDSKACIGQMFEAQVAATPNNVAAIFEDKSLTYQELNEQANQVAGFLVENQVKADSLVALCVDRSLDMFIGMLGIVKAGGAYLPIDPNLPEDRIDFMIEDAGIELVLTSSELMSELDFDDLKVLPLDESIRSRILTKYSTNNLDSVEQHSDHLAYVIYTSGSTGQPKGVMASHKNVVRLTCGAAQYIGIDEPLRVLHAAPISFDAATFEIWVPLLNGGTVCCYPQDKIDVNQINRTIVENKINLAWLTAGLFDVWVDAKDTAHTPLRTIVTGGDVVSAKSVACLYDMNPNIRVVNGYGPTECVTFACCHVVDRDIESVQSLPIGRAIADTLVYVLSDQGQPVPIGAVGELYIGGDGVSRGYLNQAALTEEKFIANPFSDDAASRLYKTGDLVRWLPQGVVEYVGRVDHQIKLRGFRIELGEIEQHLRSCTDVKDAVVTYHQDSYLVGYVLSETGNEDIKTAQLRTQLQLRLPEHMVPSIFMSIDKMPLTTNGKVDRKRLPEPDLNQMMQVQYVAPTTETEQRLCQIWSELLPVETISADVPFFDFGGNSLLAMSLTTAINEVFSVTVALRDVFEHSTVIALSVVIDSAATVEHVSISNVARDSVLPLSFAQQRLWFIDQLEGSSHYNMPSPLVFCAELDISILEHALGTIMERHEILRTIYVEIDGQPCQTIQSNSEFKLEQTSLTYLPFEQQQQELEQRVQAETARVFDLSADLMLRASIVTVNNAEGDIEHVLLLMLHHIAFDGWSMGFLLTNLTVCIVLLLTAKQTHCQHLSCNMLITLTGSESG